MDHIIKDIVPIVPLFANSKYRILLDNSVRNAELNRYSYFSADPFMIVKSRNTDIAIERNDSIEHVIGNPWEILAQIFSAQHFGEKDKQTLFPFTGGAMGYWAYDLSRYVEKTPASTNHDYTYPEMFVGLYDWVLIQDHWKRQITLAITDNHPSISPDQRYRWVCKNIQQKHIPKSNKSTSLSKVTFNSNFTREAYAESVKKVKDYLTAGDIYQANISQQFTTQFAGNSWELYKTLRITSPSPFAAYIDMAKEFILSASPELFLSLNGQKIKTRPIKGTCPTSPDSFENNMLAKELSASIKDKAENIMIVDLMRNDLGRISEIGSVEVPEICKLENHFSVWHLVSTIIGNLKSSYTGLDLLKICFPGGSITGAPKIRAMEIIAEIEPVKRGVYSGSIGYIGFNGNIQTNIAIRTISISNETAYFNVGGGIVSDSDPEDEYMETLHKAKGMIQALSLHM